MKSAVLGEQSQTGQSWLYVRVSLCGLKAASVLYLPWIGCKSPSAAMASLSCGGPLKCLRIMGKKATAWRMNHSIEPILSLTHFLPPFLSPSLSPFSCSVLSPALSSLHLPPDLSCHGIFIALLVQRHRIDILTGG